MSENNTEICDTVLQGYFLVLVQSGPEAQPTRPEVQPAIPEAQPGLRPSQPGPQPASQAFQVNKVLFRSGQGSVKFLNSLGGLLPISLHSISFE